MKGNQSYAVSIEAPLTGNFFNSGTISYIGDNGAALRSTAGSTISGQVQITGAISSQGTNSSAINLQGDVVGRLSIYSAITNTGYATTVRPTTTSTLTDLQEGANANQVEQSAGAVIVGGNVGQGIFIGAPPVGTSTSTASTVDLDGDGIADVAEGSGSITNFGSAPALTIGGGGKTTIGEFVGLEDTETGIPAGSNDYGVIIRGAVAGEGLFDGVTATGLQIGTGLANSSVTVEGGVRIVGSVSADTFEADATAIHLYAGANVAEIRNEDFIEASVSNSVVASTDTAGTVNTNAVSSGIVIENGAHVGTITNFGTIQATANGDTMQAYGVQDLSGSVTKIVNEGVISATVTPITANLTLPSTANTEPNIALDLRANTSGVELDQMVNPNPIDHHGGPDHRDRDHHHHGHHHHRGRDDHDDDHHAHLSADRRRHPARQWGQHSQHPRRQRHRRAQSWQRRRWREQLPDCRLVGLHQCRGVRRHFRGSAELQRQRPGDQCGQRQLGQHQDRRAWPLQLAHRRQRTALRRY